MDILTTTQVSVSAFRSPQGCQAHMLVDAATRDALVIDPRLDQIDEILEKSRELRARIRFVLDTHTHADHLSGVRYLARTAGAQILAHPASKAHASVRLADRSSFALGETDVRVIHSPGHTRDSLSITAGGHLFTGDALFPGGAGRTDFMGGSAADLYDSFRRFETLPDDTVVHPGHDYAGRGESTIGAERSENELMRERDRAALIARLDVAGAPPPNMKSILAFNNHGPRPDRISPLELDSVARISGAAALVDVRSTSEFSGERIPGSLNMGLGELEDRIEDLPGGREIVLICASGVRAREAMTTLLRHGRVSRVLEGGIAGWKAAGLATGGSGGLSIERQVQLTVGTGVVAGSALSILLNPWFLVLPVLLGTGLTIAGISGTCGLASLLSRMPWNTGPAGGPPSSCAAGGAAPQSSCAAGANSSEDC